MRLTQIKPYWWCIPLLLFTTCLEPDPVELPFFTVKTYPIAPNSANLIGTIVLKGEIQGIENDQVDDYGFVFSADLPFVENPNSIEQTPYRNVAINNSCSVFCFEEEDVPIDEGKNYFVRAFARKGERLVFGEIESYQVHLSFETNVIERKNDVVVFESKIEGLTDNIDISEFGVLVATNIDELNFNEAINKNHGPLSGNSQFLDTLFGVSFNTTYYFKPYAKGTNTTFGSVKTYRVTDGWIERGALPFNLGISNATVVSNGSEAYLVGGCKNPVDGPCNQNENQDINNNIYKYAPNNNEWVLHQESPFWAKSSQAFGAFYDQKIFTSHGQLGASSYNKLVDILNNLTFNACDGDYQKTYNTTSFTTADAIYFGTGRDATLSENFEQNTFWQLILDGDCMEVQAMPPLPLRVNGNDIITNAGREGAISIQANDRFFVGFGNKGGVLFNDLYEFTPPQAGGPSWDFVNTNVGPGVRTEAISFSIGDRAFVGFGYSPSSGINSYLNDLWEFCPEKPDAMWQKCEPLPAQGRRSGFGFSIDNFGYIGGGLYRQFGSTEQRILLRDTWMYVPKIDE